jgi:hypothetical protein
MMNQNIFHNQSRNWKIYHLSKKVPVVLVFFVLVLSGQSVSGNTSNSYYLPFIVLNDQICGTDSIVNGGFEQDDFGWELFSTGVGWKEHDLIGSKDEGFSPFKGNFAARLGGYEGVWDRIEQTLVIPANGELSYWWKMGTYETLPHTDWFAIDLFDLDHILIARLASHDDQDLEGIWQQDIIDLAAYEGQTLILRFSNSNDNYFFTWFDLDNVHLCSP